MTRRSTVVQDQRILNLYFQGIQPKLIAVRLELTSVHVVYEALRRGRVNGIVPRVTKIPQNSPTTKIEN